MIRYKLAWLAVFGLMIIDSPRADAQRVRLNDPPRTPSLRSAVDRWAPDFIGSHRMRPGCWCGIPGMYDYKSAGSSQPAMALSTRGELVLTRPAIAASFPDPAAPEKHIKVFQLAQPDLRVDHCAVSRFALQLHDDGDWSVSLRADQNRRDDLAVIEGRAPKTTDFRTHLKRNRFVIKLRCYGAYSVAEPAADRTTGKPVLFTLCPPPFWVESGEPLDYEFPGHDAIVRQMYPLAERVEVEFYYEPDR